MDLAISLLVNLPVILAEAGEQRSKSAYANDKTGELGHRITLL